MSNIVNANGISIQSLDEILTDLTNGYKNIYGDDANVDPDSPDGQMLNIYALSKKDVLDLIVSVYNNFNPDNAIGRSLDARCAINGIVRRGGTFTFTPIEVTVDRALTLSGLDSGIDDESAKGFAIADSSGNKFYLAQTEVFAVATTVLLSFRAQYSGKVETTPNDITTIVDTVLGVVSVNNPSAASSVGLDQETDAAFRLRRQQSVSFASTGFRDGMLAALRNINDVVYAQVYENNTSTIDSDGIPGHSIYVVIEGGTDAEVAEIIYQKRNAGCGMVSIEQNPPILVSQQDGSLFPIYFDRPVDKILYINFYAQSINGVNVIDPNYIKAQLAVKYILDVGQSTNVNDLGTIVREIDPNCFMSLAELSADGTTFQGIVDPPQLNNRFIVEAAHITITVI